MDFTQTIDNLKKQGIETYTITCDNGKECLIRKPTIKTSSKILPIMMAENADLLKAGKIIIDECWIAGDDEIRKDEDLNAEVSLAALQVVQLKVAEIKKN